jgi:hypothetical protein
MSNSDTGNSADKVQFRTAHARSFWRSVWAFFGRRNTDLVAWDEVRDKLKPQGQTSRGVHTVPIDKIVGSVGRYNDFDDAFLPRHSHLTDRWARVNRAFNADVHLPPIKLYQVGEVYFVIDGNHRVSVARQHGVAFIDAEVIEARLRVPLTEADIDARNFDMLAEYAAFLERTQVDALCADCPIRFSLPGGYERLYDHIDTHRYFRQIELNRDMSYQEAVASWLDNVYRPLIEVIRAGQVLKDFPGRTEADLYLWISQHRWYLQEDVDGATVPVSEAAHDFVEHFAHRSPLEKAVEKVGDALADVADTIFPQPGSVPGPR